MTMPMVNNAEDQDLYNSLIYHDEFYAAVRHDPCGKTPGQHLQEFYNRKGGGSAHWSEITEDAKNGWEEMAKGRLDSEANPPDVENATVAVLRSRGWKCTPPSKRKNTDV